VGVARQYSGTLGKIGNCQILVSAEYVEDAPTSSTPLHWPVSAQLYLPELWATDPARRARAHIPPEVTMQTKWEIALTLVDRAHAWGVPFALVVADAGYGDNPPFLQGLEERQVPYVCGVERTFGVRLPAEVVAQQAAGPPPYQGRGQPRKPRPAPLYAAGDLTDALPPEAWQTITWRERDDPQKPLRKQVVALRVHRATGSPRHSTSHSRVHTGPEGWLIAERPVPGESGDEKWYFSTLPAETSWARLIALAHSRWVMEQFYEDSKGECGLDDYQGRRWDGLHRHVALVMLAYSFLVQHRQTASAAPPDSLCGGRWGLSPLRAAAEPARGAPLHPGVAVPGSRAVANRK
jgi:SRSO17 transposase